MDPLSLEKVIKHEAEDGVLESEAECSNIDQENRDLFKKPKAEPEAVFISGCPNYLVSPDNVKTEVIDTMDDDQLLDNKLNPMEPEVQLSTEISSTYPYYNNYGATEVKMENNETAADSAPLDTETVNKWFIKNEELYSYTGQNVTTSEDSNTIISYGRRKKKKKPTEATQNSYSTDSLFIGKARKRIKVYRCSECNFQTTYEKNIKIHIRWHGSSKEVDEYKCPDCGFETLWKSALKRHSLRHRNPEEVKMYKCVECDFQTLQKSHLKSHVLRHKVPKDADMFKCPECDFQTLWKSYLKKHLLRHVNPETLDMFQCFDCGYQTFDKSYLKKHVLRHRDPKDVDIHKCPECQYQTTNKGNLKLHILRHRNIPKDRKYSCFECDYESLYKSNLKVHILRHHGNPKDTNTYKCFECDHQNLQNSSLETHQEKDDGGMYTCSECDYQSLRKNNLKVHMLRHHGDPKDVNTYKGFDCDCQTLPNESLSESLQNSNLFQNLHEFSLKSYTRHSNPEKDDDESGM